MTVDSHGEECFHEQAKAGTKLLTMFEVAEGGFLDIDFKVINIYCLILYLYLYNMCSNVRKM